MIDPVRHCRVVAIRIVAIADHQANRAVVQVQADFTFGSGPDSMLTGHRIREDYGVAGQRPAHRSGLEPLTRRVADLCGGLGLPEAIPDGDAPGALDLFDHLRVEWLAGSDEFAKRQLPLAQILLHQHPPHRRRRAECRHLCLPEHIEHSLGVEAKVVEEHYGCAGIPRRKEAGPGMFGPAGRAHVEVHVAGSQSDPVHRRQVADRVTDVGVLDQFRLRRGA